jgi:hypothetical protein
MCFFIAIAVPHDAAERVRAEHTVRGMQIAPTANASARAAAGPGRVPLLVTTGGCSCDWYKRPAESESEAASKLAKARARYERMGWSQAKIERALEGMTRSPRHDFGLHPVVIELLQAVARDCGSAAVWVHDFSGDVEAEPYTIAKRERWRQSEVAARSVTLAPDTLAEIGA